MTAAQLQPGDGFKLLGRRKKYRVIQTFIIATGPAELHGKLCIVIGCRQMIVDKATQVVLIE